MTQAESLYQLQQIDLTIGNAQKRLTEITTLLNDNAAVQIAQQNMNAAQQALTPLEANVCDLGHEIETATQKAKATNDQLYSGTVKNPKAMQEMQQELDALAKWQAELEDRLLEAMVALEDGQAVLTAAQTELQAATDAWQSNHSDLIAEQQTLEAKIADAQTKRQNILPSILPENLRQYTAMRPRKGNQPMALMQGNSCTLCGIEQTMNVVQEARKSDKLVACLNCGRFLVYK